MLDYEEDYTEEDELMDIKKVIDALLECSKRNRKCKKCKARKNGECQKFIRESIALALTILYKHLSTNSDPKDLYI